MSIQERDGRFQLRLKHKLLSKPYFSTFDTLIEAEEYRDGLKKRLNVGIIPRGLESEAPEVKDPAVIVVIRTYAKLGPMTDSDSALLDTVVKEIPGVRVSGITAGWVDDFVRLQKLVNNVSPGTIRKKIGVLARVLDWHLRRETPKGENPPTNQLRILPRGYSGYSREETAQLKEHQRPKQDVQRDRRFKSGEYGDIMTVLNGIRLPSFKGQRVPMARPELEMLFYLIVNSGLRLREAYSLRSDHLELDRGFTRVDGSKGHRGLIKPRIVPLTADLVAKLRIYAKDRVGLLFPFWDGAKETKKKATRDVVQLFIRLFDYAGVEDLNEHDLRHEACCRWFEMRNQAGQWKFSDVEICKIMGWSDYSMVLRYASIRGEDLAAKMAS